MQLSSLPVQVLRREEGRGNRVEKAGRDKFVYLYLYLYFSFYIYVLVFVFVSLFLSVLVLYSVYVFVLKRLVACSLSCCVFAIMSSASWKSCILELNSSFHISDHDFDKTTTCLGLGMLLHQLSRCRYCPARWGGGIIFFPFQAQNLRGDEELVRWVVACERLRCLPAACCSGLQRWKKCCLTSRPERSWDSLFEKFLLPRVL